MTFGRAPGGIQRYYVIVLAAEVRKCEACELHKTCRLPVPGIGPTNARLFIVGQSPGRQEDERNIPFIGPSGAELRAAIESIGLDWRDDVYRTNAIKCHPPGNRKGHVAERDACYSWLLAELSLWAPPRPEDAESSSPGQGGEQPSLDGPTGIIVAVGEDAARTLFPATRGVAKRSLSDLRRDPTLSFDGHPVKVILHPASLLRPGGERLRAEFDSDIESIGLRLGTVEPSAPYWVKYRYVTNVDGVVALFPALERAGVIGLDTEFTPGGIIGYSISWAEGEAAWIRREDPYAGELLEWLVYGSSLRIAIHSVQADAPVISRWRSPTTVSEQMELWPWSRTFDTALPAYVRREPAVGLKPLSLSHFGIKLSKFSETWGNAEHFAGLPPGEQYVYACADADIARRLALGPYRKEFDEYFQSARPEDQAH